MHQNGASHNMAWIMLDNDTATSAGAIYGGKGYQGQGQGAGLCYTRGQGAGLWIRAGAMIPTRGGAIYRGGDKGARGQHRGGDKLHFKGARLNDKKKGRG